MKAKNKLDYYGDFLSLEDVCNLLNKSDTTVKRYIQLGQLNFKKLGGDWVMLKQDLIDYFRK